MNKGLLEKYCSNRCTEEELSSVLEWFEKSARTPEGKTLLFKIWDELPEKESNLQIDFDFILDKIHHKVNLDLSKKLLNESGENLVKYKRRKHFIMVLTKIAAILMLPVFSFGLYMSFKYQSAKHDQPSVNQAYNEVFSSVDAITKVSLPDGSNVWLNHSSTLKYPGKFQGDSRIVELNGEGYFEVAHNPKIPFIVKVGEIQVLARGTTFNILAYPNEDKIETSLINGSVVLQMVKADKDVVQLLEMKPSDQAIYRKSDKKVIARSIEDDRYYSWKDGKLMFKNESLKEVAKKLGRWFNVDIQVADSELLDLTYTATFIHETLTQVMEFLEQATPISYSISNPEEISQGTFTKRKVILNYRKKQDNIRPNQ
jgi:transmembrane sensor